MFNLGERLKTVAGFVDKAAYVADIGTDHAYLPVYLIQQGIGEQAIACDVHQGPFEVAKQTVKMAGLTNKISVRLGDGLAPLVPGEVDTAAIAGMGGTTMVEILKSSPEVVNKLKKLILQPMNSASELRRWLVNNGWRLDDEELVVEDGRMYEVICAVPDHREETIEIEDILYFIGPCLWEKRHSLLKEHIEILLSQNNKVMTAMQDSEAAKQTERYQQYAKRIEQLEVKLQCL